MYVDPILTESSRPSQGDNFEANAAAAAKLEALALKKGCTAAQLALAWVHSRGDDVFPIPGSKTVKHLVDNVGAVAIKVRDTALFYWVLSAVAPRPLQLAY